MWVSDNKRGPIPRLALQLAVPLEYFHTPPTYLIAMRRDASMVPHFHRASELMPCDLSHRRAAATLHGITSLIRVFRSEASVIPAVATSSKAAAADVLIMSWHSLLDLPALTASRSLSRLPRPVDAFGARLMRVMAGPL